MAKKRLPIKTLLLDQSIMVGLGNIYVDEVLFLSSLNPNLKYNELTDADLEKIIDNSKIVLEKAIKMAGTTIRTYESSEGVHGMFQDKLLVHNQQVCKKCGSEIVKTRIGGRGTYYCPKCQK